MSKRAKCVTINQKEYDSEIFLSRFEKIKHKLKEALNDPTLSTKALAQATGQWILFQDDQFGRYATGAHSRKYTKIPHKLFQDYREDGALYTILYHSFKFKEENGWRKFDFSLPQKLEKNLELFERVYTALIESGHLTFPKVYFDSSISSRERSKLADIVQRHGATIVESETEATHIVVKDPNPPNPRDLANTEYCRTVERRERSVLVHWWYYPDSYDSWVPANQVEGEAEPVTPKDQWTVTERWVYDTELFNEWPNEEDYEPEEVDEELSTSSRRRRSAVEARESDEAVLSDASAEADETFEPITGRSRRSVQKRNYSELSDEDEDDMDFEEYERKRRKTTPSKRDYTRELSRLPKTPPSQQKPVKDKTSTKDAILTPLVNQRRGAGKSATREMLREHIRPQTIVNLSNNFGLVITTSNEQPMPSLVLPPHAQWFDMSTIHDLEKKALPEFFEESPSHPSKTPAVYKEYRDFMINAYQQNPSHYLTVTACRRNLSGDAAAILRVHDFLEHAGLINFAVQPDVTGLFPPPPVPDPSDAVQQLFLLDPLRGARPKKVETNLQARKFIGSEQVATVVRNTCSMCASVCSDVMYRHSSIKDLCICKSCYSNGHFPDNVSSTDFVVSDMLKELVDESEHWTDEETLKLLEALEQYGEDNWEKVAEMVGTKNAHQCVLHFLRLPIEDAYMQRQLFSTKQGSDAPEGRVPFGGLANPIMSLLVFLREVVSPQVAAAAAQAALKTLAELELDAAKAKQLADNMDVDNPNGTDKNLSKEDQDLMLNIRASASAALAAATIKANLLVEKEEAEMQRLTYRVVEAYIKKIELKAKYLDEFERVLNEEKLKIKRAQEALLAEKAQFEKVKRAMANVAAATPATSVATTANGH